MQSAFSHAARISWKSSLMMQFPPFFLHFRQLMHGEIFFPQNEMISTFTGKTDSSTIFNASSRRNMEFPFLLGLAEMASRFTGFNSLFPLYLVSDTDRFVGEPDMNSAIMQMSFHICLHFQSWEKKLSPDGHIG